MIPLTARRLLELLSYCVALTGLLVTIVLAADTHQPQQQPLGKQDGATPFSTRSGPRQPNIIFILTDDQDQHMSSLDYMPHLQNHLIQQGTTFRHHYCTVALCCPSRVSLWTGKHAHNTNVTDVNPPHGGYPKFVSQGFNENYLPLWMQDVGYDTYYVGKLFNAHSTSNYNKPYPRGWNASDFLLDPFTYEYLNATMQRNIENSDHPAIHDAPQSYEGSYITDIIADKSLSFLEDALSQRYDPDGNGRPFFLTIAPTSPHSNVHIHTDLSGGGGKYRETTATQSPPIPAPRHAHLFPDAVVPRTPDFNPDTPNSASWLASLPQQNDSNIASNDAFYRARLRALQSVDEIIPRLVLALEFSGALKETHIVYTTDNGYHIGQHRLQPGKQCAWETDVNVPFIVRGPGVLAGRVEGRVSSHVDLASTFLSLAGIGNGDNGWEEREGRYALDGEQMNFHAYPSARDENELGNEDSDHDSDRDCEDVDSTNSLEALEDVEWEGSSLYQSRGIGEGSEHVNIEMWGIIMPEGKYGTILYPNHTYKALRVISADRGQSYNLLYVVWCSNEHELYDLTSDPYALDNLFVNKGETERSVRIGVDRNEQGQGDAEGKTEVDLKRVVDRLDALLMVLKSCAGWQCTRPWEQLHRDLSVNSLYHALHESHDGYYQQIPKVVFERCEEAYIPEVEGAMWKGGEGLVDMWPIMT